MVTQNGFVRQHSLIDRFSWRMVYAFSRKHKLSYKRLKKASTITNAEESKLESYYSNYIYRRVAMPAKYKGKVSKREYIKSIITPPRVFTDNLRLFDYDLSGYPDISSLAESIADKLYLFAAGRAIWAKYLYQLKLGEHYTTVSVQNCPKKGARKWMISWVENSLYNFFENELEKYKQVESMEDEIDFDDMALLLIHGWFYIVFKKRG